MSNSHTGLIEAFPPHPGAGAFDGQPEARPRLLIVDDISDNRNILKRRFERRGFDVTEAESGLVAIDLIDQSPFDLVLLDVNMPKMDGFTFLRRLKRSIEWKNIAVIMITTEAAQAKVMDAFNLGAAGYIRKPFSADQIKEKLESLALI